MIKQFHPWASTVTVDQLKKIVYDNFEPLTKYHPGIYWVIIWIAKIQLTENGYFFEAAIAPLKEKDPKLVFTISKLDIQKTQTIFLPLRIMRILPMGTGFAIFNSVKLDLSSNLKLFYFRGD